MFELKISNIYEALQLSQQWATHTISLLDPDFSNEIMNLPVASEKGLVQRYYFSDICKGRDFTFSSGKSKLASSKQILDILEFTTPLQSKDKLLIHCHAGISRSTAVACGVLCQHGLHPNESVKYILSIRPQALPNKHVLALFDDILKLDGSLITAGTEEVDKFYRDRFF